jgi:hypothetical protein
LGTSATAGRRNARPSLRPDPLRQDRTVKSLAHTTKSVETPSDVSLTTAEILELFGLLLTLLGERIDAAHA